MGERSITLDSRLPTDPRFKNLTGNEYGLLKVTGLAGYKAHATGRTFYWECECKCGGSKVSSAEHLKNGETKSCGCYRRAMGVKKSTVHGDYGSPEYRTWQKMLSRCVNPNAKFFSEYGGRGINVCDRWRTYQNFLDDMGRRPSDKHSIDRIDNNGNYEPVNCRWATDVEQARNKRSNVIVEANGQQMCIGAWCEVLRVSYACLYKQVRRGKFGRIVNTEG